MILKMRDGGGIGMCVWRRPFIVILFIGWERTFLLELRLRCPASHDLVRCPPNYRYEGKSSYTWTKDNRQKVRGFLTNYLGLICKFRENVEHASQHSKRHDPSNKAENDNCLYKSHDACCRIETIIA